MADSDYEVAMKEGARRSAQVNEPSATHEAPAVLRALWQRRRKWIIGLLLFILLDLIVALGVAGSAGHF